MWVSWIYMDQLEMLLIPNALCWSSQKCYCAWLPAELQLRLSVTCRSWQKLFAGKNFVINLVNAQTQLRSYSEQQRAFGNSNICNCWGNISYCVVTFGKFIVSQGKVLEVWQGFQLGYLTTWKKYTQNTQYSNPKITHYTHINMLLFPRSTAASPSRWTTTTPWRPLPSCSIKGSHGNLWWWW